VSRFIADFHQVLAHLEARELDAFLDGLLGTVECGGSVYLTGYGRKNEVCALFATV